MILRATDLELSALTKIEAAVWPYIDKSWCHKSPAGCKMYIFDPLLLKTILWPNFKVSFVVVKTPIKLASIEVLRAVLIVRINSRSSSGSSIIDRLALAIPPYISSRLTVSLDIVASF